MKIHPAEPPRNELAHLPTPLVEARNLARHLSVPRILIKRDDLTGLETTGNKVRKLEYVLAEALAAGADTLVTNGGYQSNHCRATAAVGARLGLRVRLILRSPEPEPPNDGNLFLDRLLGAHVSLHPVQEYNAHRKELIDAAMDTERRAGRTPYFFPVGASIPLGCWGYVRAMHELATQLDADGRYDLFVTAGSSGTLAGMVLGRALFNLRDWRIVGVPISDSVEFFKKDVRDLVDRTADEYRLDVAPAHRDVELIGGFIGGGYAVPDPAALETLRLVARTEGILLDPTYTAKAFTGMLATLGAGGLRPGAVPVFLHTGGLFGLMARRDLFPP